VLVVQDLRRRYYKSIEKKNERLESLLMKAMRDINELKEREKNRAVMENQVKIHAFPAPGDFGTKSVPAVAMFSVPTVRPGELIQCNDSFKQLVDRTWEELSTGFSCCNLFPRRIIKLLLPQYMQMKEKLFTHFERDLAIMRPNGDEIPVRAFYHMIYDDNDKPLYKMLYLFPVQSNSVSKLALGSAGDEQEEKEMFAPGVAGDNSCVRKLQRDMPNMCSVENGGTFCPYTGIEISQFGTNTQVS